MRVAKITLTLLVVSIALILFQLHYAWAEPSSDWLPHATPKTYEKSFDEVYGGDVFTFTGSDIVRLTSGLIFREDFDTLNPSLWDILAGTCTVGGGAAVCDAGGAFALLQLMSEVRTGVFEVRVKLDVNTLAGVALSSDPSDTSDPFVSALTAASVGAKVDTSTAVYNPPTSTTTALPDVVPTDEPLYFRIIYREEGGSYVYDAYLMIESQGLWWKVTEDQITSYSVPNWLRLVVENGVASFDSVIIYPDTVVEVTGLLYGAVVQLIQDGNVKAEVMADSTGTARLDVSSYAMPLRDVTLKVVIPPATFNYTTWSAATKYGWGRIDAKVENASETLITYSYDFSSSTYVDRVSWIVPSRSSVINLTIWTGSTILELHPAFESAGGELKTIVFNVASDVQKMKLYLEAPNIATELRIRSLDRDLEGARDLKPGEDVQITVFCGDAGWPLEDADVKLKVVDRRDFSIFQELEETSNATGYAVFELSYPNGPAAFRSEVTYPANSTPLYFGLLIRETRAVPNLQLLTPSEAIVGEPFTLTAVLKLDSEGIGGATIKFYYWDGVEWHLAASNTTLLDGSVSVRVSALSSGVLRVKAAFDGNSFYAPTESSEEEFLVKLRASLSLSAPSRVYVQKAFTIKCTINVNNTPLSGVTLILQRREASGSWTQVDTSTTSTNGTAVFQRTEPRESLVLYRCYFPGSPTYSQAFSRAVLVRVARVPTKLILELPSKVNVTIPFEVKAKLLSVDEDAVSGRTIKLYRAEVYAGEEETGPNGVAVFQITELWAHKVKYEFVFEGDEIYAPSNEVIIVDVGKLSVRLKLYISKLPVYVGEKFSLAIKSEYVNGTPAPSLNIKIVADNKLIGSVVTNSSGEAEAEIPGLPAGLHKLRAYFLGDALRDPASKILEVMVEKLRTSVRIRGPSAVEEGQKFEILVTVIDQFGRPAARVKVAVYKDGKLITSGYTDESGSVKLYLSEENMGTYKYTVTVHENEKYIESKAEFEVHVRMATWKLVLAIVAIASIIIGFIVYKRRRGRGGESAVATPPPPPPPLPPQTPPEAPRGQEELEAEEDETRVYM